MTMPSVDINSVNTYQAIAEHSKKPNDSSLLPRIGYASFCDAGTHTFYAISKLPSAIINRQLTPQILHVKRAIAHLALLASLPFSLVKHDCVTNTAEFLGLKNQPQTSLKAKIRTATVRYFNETTKRVKQHPYLTLGLTVGAGVSLGILAYAMSNRNELPSPPAEPIKVEPEVTLKHAIIFPLVIGGAALLTNQFIGRFF
ncbi:MAG: hypothetical protein Q8K75_07190 [Chlamydiales bacterium]|nr:hypothetical protein [Chlamydiales bacterium]